MSEKLQTTREKRLAKISQLEAQLQKEKARLNADKRKERNGQLIAFGVFLEEYLKQFPDRITSMKQLMEKLLEGRNLNRAIAGVERISTLVKQRETISEEVLVEGDWEATPYGTLKVEEEKTRENK